MKNTIRICTMVVLTITAAQNSSAQDWSTNGNEINVTEWFGADDNSLIPVQFRHEADIANSYFEWFTTDGTTQPRMRLTRGGRLGLNHSAPADRFHIRVNNTGSTQVTRGALITHDNIGNSNNDGLFLGMRLSPTNTVLEGMLHWQESSRFAIMQNARPRIVMESYNYGGYNNFPSQNSVNRTKMPYGIAPGLTNTAFSVLHMGITVSESLRRDWLNIGTTYTGGSDIFYVGLLHSPRPDDTQNHVDAVLAWGCDEGQDTLIGPDNFRILFYKPENQTPINEANQDQGREVMRITPMGNVGIGDFSHMPSGLNEQPTLKLDVDGTARLRQMPDSLPNVLITGVRPDTLSTNDFILNYLEFPGDSSMILSGAGVWLDGSDQLCDWNVVNGGLDLAMGYDTACVVGNVGIGNLPPSNVKLYVEDTLDVFSSMGVRVQTIATAPFTTGLMASIESIEEPATHVTGIHGIARNGKAPIGGHFEATGDANFLSQPAVGVLGRGQSDGPTGGGNMHNAIGVYGLGTSTVNCDRPIGVYGQAINFTGCAPPVAGYFAGVVVDSQQPITLSDENIKSDVNPIEDATELLLQIVPSSYNYVSDENSQNAYSSELNYGFLAQQVQEVIPNVVHSVPAPMHITENGQINSSGEELLGIQYGQFIPLLVAAFQEQHSRLEELTAENDELNDELTNQVTLIMQMHEQMQMMSEQMQMLQQQIDGCCMDQGWVPKSSEMGQQDLMGKNELYQNTPNPFRNHTTIRYTLEQGGRVMLKIHDSNGREVAQLENAEQSADTYTYVWDAAGLPAGLYHYTLFVDDELLVKRAIKLHD